MKCYICDEKIDEYDLTRELMILDCNCPNGRILHTVCAQNWFAISQKYNKIDRCPACNTVPKSVSNDIGEAVDKALVDANSDATMSEDDGKIMSFVRTGQ